VTGQAFIQHCATRSLGDVFADAANCRDYDRFASLWTDEGIWEVWEVGEPTR
jgi:hypothetical protein